MSSGITVTSKITGARELERALELLPKRVQERVLKNAVRAGGRIIQAEMIVRAPEGHEPARRQGRLKKNIKVTALPAVSVSAFTVSVHSGRAFWGSFDEFGAKASVARGKLTRKGGKGSKRAVLFDKRTGQFFGKRVGARLARPWARPAFEAKKFAALDAIGKSLGRGIEREAIKLAGPQGRKSFG
jgi:HK97 gp10 family phage protein